MNRAPPASLPLSRDCAAVVAKIEFVSIDRYTGLRAISAGTAIDATLAETDFAAALDDSLLELLVVASHRHRPPLIKM